MAIQTRWEVTGHGGHTPPSEYTTPENIIEHPRKFTGALTMGYNWLEGYMLLILSQMLLAVS